MTEETLQKAVRLYTEGKVDPDRSNGFHLGASYRVQGTHARYRVCRIGNRGKGPFGWFCSCPAGMRDHPEPCSHIGACMLYEERTDALACTRAMEELTGTGRSGERARARERGYEDV